MVDLFYRTCMMKFGFDTGASSCLFGMIVNGLERLYLSNAIYFPTLLTILNLLGLLIFEYIHAQSHKHAVSVAIPEDTTTVVTAEIYDFTARLSARKELAA